jgi:hypothetical protein
VLRRRHYLEMVVAMLVGMGVLSLLWNIDWPGLSTHEGLHAAVMVADMCIGMSAWMRIHRAECTASHHHAVEAHPKGAEIEAVRTTGGDR